ncbi:MAG: sulfurtransferase-like selenium metabolism protein YedF [Firmicutes bacterium HGW-Firmicutes-1]|jgi:selenium metabolism protein YedF|nr:MAG: sulfurtransferase-like selenium metabolism protein YedF [Firmicutes bacterium HGW-Firmicutes-1]
MDRVIIINSESFGSGDEVLGKKLMGAFLRKVWASPNKPETIILYNSAVKIAATGSEVLDAVNGLFEAGVDILACGTCVSHFKLEKSLKAARVSNMDEIADIMLTAKTIVTV